MGLVGALTGTGGGVLAVPILLWLGITEKVAVGTSFVNMIFLVLASLLLYGVKGSIDWKIGAMLGVGTVVGAYIGITYVQPLLSGKSFRYIFAVFLIAIAISLLLKK